MTLKRNLKSYICLTLVGLFASWLPAQSSADEIDPRHASMSCGLEGGDVLACKYRTSSTLSLKEVSIKVDGNLVQIPDGGLKSFPKEGESVAVLVLLDVSDPARKDTVENKSAKLINYFVSARKSYEKIGVATFDSELTVLAPIGASNEQISTALKKVKATGQSTEFYKSILAGIEVLEKTDADRKGLVVISDGKDEDKAYGLTDVIRSAKSANVSIMGVGIAEKPSDSPYLQTLKRLSDETFGEYVNASDNKLDSSFISKPFGFVEKGGEILIDAKDYHGVQRVELLLGVADGKVVELSTNVNFDQDRSLLQRAVGFVLIYWLWLAVGLIALVVSVLLFIKVRKARKASMKQEVDYASLSETDGLCTRHAIRKTASRIGRSKDNDIVLANDSISSHHAEIHMRREGVFYIVDLSSTNGVYVNDQRVNQTELKDGDLIELGEVRLRFLIAS